MAKTIVPTAAPDGTVGRPPYAPTKALRNKVAILKAGGMTDEDIARAIGISRMSLYKHFSEELSTLWAAKRAEVVMAQFVAATKGKNVAAQGKFLQRSERVMSTPTDGELEAPAAGTPEAAAAAAGKKMREQPLGKKEAAILAAKQNSNSTPLSGLIALRASGKLEVN